YQARSNQSPSALDRDADASQFSIRAESRLEFNTKSAGSTLLIVAFSVHVAPLVLVNTRQPRLSQNRAACGHAE
ncbi:MAG TPA: hypothetical protein VEX68_13105, partial [Bryobacteraceae bacterium]|nr:hypothetical protein [Bryobacteraceae bacterium]